MSALTVTSELPEYQAILDFKVREMPLTMKIHTLDVSQSEFQTFMGALDTKPEEKVCLYFNKHKGKVGLELQGSSLTLVVKKYDCCGNDSLRFTLPISNCIEGLKQLYEVYLGYQNKPW